MKDERALAKLPEFLRQSGIAFQQGVPLEDILRAEQGLSVRIPRSLVAMLEICGGTDAERILAKDPQRHIRLWGLRELRVAESNEVGPWEPALMFADYLVHSIEFGISTRDDKIILANGSNSKAVADSLDEFIAGYIRDDPRVFGIF